MKERAEKTTGHRGLPGEGKFRMCGHAAVHAADPAGRIWDEVLFASLPLLVAASCLALLVGPLPRSQLRYRGPLYQRYRALWFQKRPQGTDCHVNKQKKLSGGKNYSITGKRASKDTTVALLVLDQARPGCRPIGQFTMQSKSR